MKRYKVDVDQAKRAARTEARQALIDELRDAREDGAKDAATYWLGKPNLPSAKWQRNHPGFCVGDHVWFCDDVYELAFIRGTETTKAALREVAASQVVDL